MKHIVLPVFVINDILDYLHDKKAKETFHLIDSIRKHGKEVEFAKPDNEPEKKPQEKASEEPKTAAQKDEAGAVSELKDRPKGVKAIA